MDLLQDRPKPRWKRVVAMAAALAVVAVAAYVVLRNAPVDKNLPVLLDTHRSFDAEYPFEGTEAQEWADGEMGIVPPDQAPEYAAAYAAVRRAITAGHLDPKMIVEHNPDGLLALLTPASQDLFHRQEDSTIATRLKPGTKLVPKGIKVDGTMRPGRDEKGRPIVHTSYRIAYAFDPGDRKALVDAYDVVAMVRTDTDFLLTDQGLDVLRSEGFSFAMACEAAKDGYLAPMFTEPQPTGGQTFSPAEGFAADAPLDGGTSCG